MMQYSLWCQTPFGQIFLTSLLTQNWRDITASVACMIPWDVRSTGPHGQRELHDNPILPQIRQNPRLPQEKIPSKTVPPSTPGIYCHGYIYWAGCPKRKPGISFSLSLLIGLRICSGFAVMEKHCTECCVQPFRSLDRATQDSSVHLNGKRSPVCMQVPRDVMYVPQRNKPHDYCAYYPK